MYDKAVKDPVGSVCTKDPTLLSNWFRFGLNMSWWAHGSSVWAFNLPSVTALMESWSPFLISPSNVSLERILGIFCETLVPPWRKRFLFF
jgi:hypothetical protein